MRQEKKNKHKIEHCILLILANNKTIIKGTSACEIKNMKSYYKNKSDFMYFYCDHKFG